ncbi:MAG: Ig-like domain-containing protein, partial [Chitinophagaceae bacterium]
SGTATITVGPASVGGTIAGSASVCSGTNSTVLTLSGNTGNITKWQSAITADFSGTVTDISNTTSSLTATNLATTTYYRAVVQSGSCTAANSGTASITVSNCIQANPDNNTTSVNIPVSGNVATNDVIAAGTNYGTPTAFNTNPTGATITIDAASGNYTFTTTKPGKYEFYVPVCGAGQTSNCQLTLLQIIVLDPTIPNNLPVANADIATTNLNTAVTTSVLNNDKSGNIGTDLVPSSVSIVTQPVNGTAVANSDGTITYTPTSGFSGNDSLVYKVCDNATPANCQTTLVYYKVLSTGASSVTSAIDDYAFVNNNKTGTASVSGNVLSNDKNSAGSALTASLVTGPTAAQGTLKFNADGSFTFVPALGFNGPIDIVYNACTGDSPAICAKATLHIVVNPPPTINPDFNSTNINTPVPGSINTNDIIPAGTTYGTPIASGNNPLGATISINAATGTYTFTASKPGKYIFNVPVCAASQTTGCPISPLQITVLDPNITTNPPVANNDYSVTQLNTPVVTTILANDKPGNQNTSLIPTSIVINTAPKNGTATANKATSKSGSSTGIKSFSTNGTITYTPNPGFVGLDSLLYTVCDNANPANCEIATVYYTISTATPNNVLVANDDYNTSVNRVPATGNVLLNDDYGGAALTASLITGPLSSQGVFTLIADGSYSFTPAFGFTGPVDIIYQACSGTTCINATLHILVNVVPPPPPTVINATYVAGSKSNPTNIESLVTATPTGTTLQWCDPTGVTCSSIPPTIPNVPGTYIWCVKSVDTVTQLSSTCVMDTVIILAPYTVMEVTKTVRSVQSNPDGSVLLTFVLKAANKTNAVMDSVSVIDDLTQTFKASSGFTVAALDVYGGLIKNSTYDGISNINLVTNQSKIAANSMDSAILKVLVASPDIFGSLTNTAVLGGKTKYGYVSVNSNDPLANPTDTTKRVPTGFNVPKADLIIAGGFSPNFDGYNDKWIIIRPFGTRVEVKVFNRWGNIVYQNADYKNDWNGIGATNFMGQDVPDGTYFYIVNAVEPSGTIKKFTSSLTIVR